MGNKKRILILGFNKNDEKIEEKDDEVIESINWKNEGKYGSYLHYFPTIFDYDIVLLHPSTFQKYYDKLAEKKDEFSYFFKSGGIISTTLVPKKVYTSVDNYSWFPGTYKFDLMGKSGSSFQKTNQTQQFNKIFDKYQHNWLDSIKILHDETSRVIAKNRAGNPISFILKMDKGKIIFLPNLKYDENNKFGFQRELIDIIKKMQKTNQVKTNEPKWLSEYNIENELEIDEKIRELNKRKSLFNSIKKLLYEDGFSLTEAVSKVLESFDFNIENKENNGREDIEIFDKETNFHGIIEVTGSINPIPVRKLRQLVQWYMEQIEKDADVVPILIANAFREENPKDRNDFFTQEARNLANKKIPISLVSTYDLFNYYNKYLEGTFSKKDLIKIFLKK